VTAASSGGLSFGVFFQAWAAATESDEATISQVIRSTELADGCGYDVAWFTEQHAHLLGGFWGRIGTPHLMMAHLAARTSRIGLGAAVRLVADIDPSRLAEEIVTLEHLAGRGRTHLGIGAGMTPGGDPAERARRRKVVRHHGSELDALLRGRDLDGAQELAVTMSMPELADRVYVATTDRRQIEQAARLGQGYLVGMFGGGRHPSMVRDFRGFGGRGPVRAVRLVHVGVDDVRAVRTVETVARRFWDGFRPPSQGWRAAKERLGRHPALESILQQLGWIVGGPETVAEAVTEYSGACGLDGLDLAFHPPGLSSDAADLAMSDFATRVIPRIRRDETQRAALQSADRTYTHQQ